MTASDELAGARALVLGLGRFGGGLGATRWLAARGARVTVTDAADPSTLAESAAALEPLVSAGQVELILGRHRGDDFDRADLVVANPAVRPDSPWLVRARAGGARVTSEIGLFLERCTAPWVAVTGTQGKSSTATFLEQLLTHAGRRARAGGNLGGSVLVDLDALAPDEVVVLELSSYQLEALERPPRLARPASALAVTGILADHLDRHGTLEAYAAAKRRLLELAGDDPGCTILLPDRGPAAGWGATDVRIRRHGAGCETGADDDQLRALGEPIAPAAELALPAFQHANAALALALARTLGVPAPDLAAAAPTLRAPAHRLEALGAILGRQVLDNGVSTTPDSTLGVLSSVPPAATLLVGGKSKGLDWSGLARACAERGDRTFTFGADAEAIRAALAAAGASATACGALEDAVEQALLATPAGGTLLFSPACASFDAFVNFADRARCFRAALARLESASGR